MGLNPETVQFLRSNSNISMIKTCTEQINIKKINMNIFISQLYYINLTPPKQRNVLKEMFLKNIMPLVLTSLNSFL